MQSLLTLGRKIYSVEKWREFRRMIVFIGRGVIYHDRLEEIDRYFQQDEVRRTIAEIYPFVYEQPTRAFFYNKSTFTERIALLKEHFDLLLANVEAAAVEELYRCQEQMLWSMAYEENRLRLVLYFEAGQRKEGLMAAELRLGDIRLYQMIFWLAHDKVGQKALWIGAMQGPNVDDARELVKRMTKSCHGYRTKNLILYATQAIARNWGMEKIYAVTNHGYYANNHVRIDRKLKTSFSDFWQEAGGVPAADERFYELPLSENRKSAEEIPTRKRAVYRRRFALLDELDETVAASLAKLAPKP